MGSLTLGCGVSVHALAKRCKTLDHLRQLHAHIIHRRLEQDHVLVSYLLSLSVPFSISYATSIFCRLRSPSIVLCNILLHLLSRNSHFHHSFSFFVRLKRARSPSPDHYTYASLLSSCARHSRLKEARLLHGSLMRSGFASDLYVGSSLIDLYGKCGRISDARRVFDEMSVRNVVSWTAMVVSYAKLGDLGNAKRMFDQMPRRNLASWNAMIAALLKSGDLPGARKLFDEMPQKDIALYTVMIDGYAKAGDMTFARALFEEAPKRDIVAWSALISGYAQNGQPVEAVNMFHKMQSMNVQPDEFIMVSLMSACSQLGSLDLAKWVDSFLSRSSINIHRPHVVAALIDMNAKCGNMDRAKTLFEEMPKRDLFSYCSMMQGLSIHGHGVGVIELFDRMLDEGLIPDAAVFTVILTVCSKGSFVEEGCHYFKMMKSKYSVVPSPHHYACMVDLLSRAGRLKEAYELLKSMPMEPYPSAWGALLRACKFYGDVELGEVVANKLFELEPENAGNYVLLSDIYAARDLWSDVALIREKMMERGIRKMPGRTWI